MKKKVEVWPKVRRLSKSVTAHLFKTGTLQLSYNVLTKAEVRRLYVFLSGRDAD